MGGLTSLLNKQPSSNGPVSKTQKNFINQWPHFFPKQNIPPSYQNSNSICPDMSGRWHDNSILKIPLNSGFATSLTNKSMCPNSAIAKSELMKGEEIPTPTPTNDYDYEQETSSSPPLQIPMPQFEDDLKYHIFGLLCGHGDSVIAHYVDQILLEKIHEKFSDVKTELARSFRVDRDWVNLKHEPFACCQTDRIPTEEVIMGALEQSFYEVDTHIGNNWHTLGLTGGCSVIICIIINGFLYIANAGKCRANLYSENNPCTQITADSTPDYDRQRIQSIAYLQPQMLTPDYTRLQFEFTLREEHRGRKVLYRDKHMSGWAYMQVKETDINKVPIITGVGDKSRLFGLDIPSRGIGYYGQKAPGCIPFKPFITAIPEITSIDIGELSKGSSKEPPKQPPKRHSLVLTSPDCSKYLSVELIQSVMNKGYANGTDPRHREHNPSQVQAFNVLSLASQIANSTNLEKQIVSIDDNLLEDSRTAAHDPGLACLVIPLNH